MLPEPLFRYFSARTDLSDRDRRVLGELFDTRRRFVADGAVVLEPDARPNYSILITAGFVARYHPLATGQRQLTALHIPGDFVDLHGFLLRQIDHGLVALTDCTFMTVKHTRLRDFSVAEPHLTRLLWLSTVIDAAIHRAWILAAGRRKTEQQIAHFLCEMFRRLRIVEMTRDHTFSLPLKQKEIAALMGRSDVHVNRAVQKLRKSGLVTWTNSHVTLHDFAALAELGEFDDTYLSDRIEPR